MNTDKFLGILNSEIKKERETQKYSKKQHFTSTFTVSAIREQALKDLRKLVKGVLRK